MLSLSADVWVLLIAGCLFSSIICPPVTENHPGSHIEDDENLGLSYEQYLKEVVSVLESDATFKKKLHESNTSDIRVDQLSYQKYLREVINLLMSDPEFSQRMADAVQNISQQSGEIAKHLDFVSHGIRTKLDEVKRKELDRLRSIMKLQSQFQSGHDLPNSENLIRALDRDRLLAHLDHSNPHSFEVSDLARLVQQASKDLEDIDKQRREEFKKYEMEKEVARLEQLSKLDEKERAEAEKKFQEMEKKHKDHPKLHHPGNEAQLKEVWEESDGLNKQDFDPRTFFYLHDTNGDGVLDQAEIEALFQKELDKVYNPYAPEDDMTERYEEMNRMREHVMNEVDKDKDKMVSLYEFIESTKKEEFKRDEGWETLDSEKVYSESELEEFRKQYNLKREELMKQQQIKAIIRDRVYEGSLDRQPVKTMQQHNDINADDPHQRVNEVKRPRAWQRPARSFQAFFRSTLHYQDQQLLVRDHFPSVQPLQSTELEMFLPTKPVVLPTEEVWN